MIVNGLRKAVDAGVSIARYDLADTYLFEATRIEGPERTAATKKVVEWLRPDDAKNIAQIQYFLYIVYSFGDPGFPRQDLVRARRYLETAARAGVTAAQVALANELSQQEYPWLTVKKSLGLKPIAASAFEWASLAAAGEDMNAHLILACMYNNGYGVVKDEMKAREHCETAIKADFAPAFTWKGVWVYYDIKDSGFTLNRRLDHEDPLHFSADLWKRAGELGDSWGYYWLGRRSSEIVEKEAASHPEIFDNNARNRSHAFYLYYVNENYSIAIDSFARGARMDNDECRKALLDRKWWWTGKAALILKTDYPESAEYFKSIQEQSRKLHP